LRYRASLPPVDFSIEIPSSLLKVFDVVALMVSTPDVLDRVAETETHPLHYIDALDARSLAVVVERMVDVAHVRIRTILSRSLAAGA
jgi:hypothetical protein